MMLKRAKTVLLVVMFVAFIMSLLMFNTTPANANTTVTYGEIATSAYSLDLEDDAYGRLTKINGWESIEQVGDFETTATMPNENEGSAVTNGYAYYVHPYYSQITKNAIKFDTPISSEDMLASGGLTIRMYLRLSSADTFLVKSHKNDLSFGIYFYGLGATGDFSDHPIWVPADITQNEYVDFKINAYDASLLADDDGYINGIKIASHIDRDGTPNASDEMLYMDAYMYIKSISFDAPNTTPTVAGEIKTYQGMNGLTHVNGTQIDANPSTYNNYWSGFSTSDIVPGFRISQPITELPKDNGVDVESAYRFTWANDGTVAAKNSVLFEKPLSIADIENSNGLSLRILAHLTEDGEPYKRFNEGYGLFFHGYGKGVTGETGAVVIPADIVQNEWTDLHISAETLKNMVGEDGYLYGLNYGARITAIAYAPEGNWINYPGTTMYFSDSNDTSTNPGYVLLSKVTLEEKTYSVTFKNGEETVNSYSAVSGSEIVMATAPAVQGKVFVGWETDSKLYSNTSELSLSKDVVFNAVYVSFNMGEGASIRLDEPTGIRFITYLNSADLDAVKALVGADKVSLGVRVVRGDSKSLEIAASNTLQKGEDIIFNGVIKNLTKDFYTVTYTGTGFMDITYSDNTIGRIYANSNDNTRTIAQVAQAAIEDTEIVATEFYTEAQYNLLRSFYEQQEA